MIIIFVKKDSMTSYELGSTFEQITKEFFVWLFEEIGYVVIKERTQFNGTQDGFDIQINVTINNFERVIFIECKNYKTDLDIGNILKKVWDLEKNYTLKEHDLFLAINPKSNFKNSDNSEKASNILDEKFLFNSYLLDTSNSIKELFAINRLFYKEIYGKELDFEVDKEKEINRFKNMLSSRKPFKKVFLTENDKLTFLTDIKPNYNYISRYLNENLKDENYDFSLLYVRNKNKIKTLNQIIQEDDKILILGNPGLGKSTELKQFALSRWNLGEQLDFTPIFRNLKNFTSHNSIEDFLPKKFLDIANMYIIFDGIDEIKDTQDFISKLGVFIDTHKSKPNSIKYVLSCRTNIYGSIVKNISGFKIYYLSNLSSDDAFLLLKNKLDNPDLINSLLFHKAPYDFLKNPFLVEILSEYINRNHNLPSNSIELWESYISKRLEFDNEDKLLKLNLNTSVIKKFSKKLSLISELMKSNSVSEEEILDLIFDKKLFDDYLKNPLIEKDLTNGKWNFEHRNIQEYFAARYLSELSVKEIINFICISVNERKGGSLIRKMENIFRFIRIPENKTHPSLFNTITFLLNILDTKKSELVIKWLETNEPEILFTADSDRITLEVKKNVFQNYFKSICIEKTFWISHNRSFNAQTIGEFGDCEDNFNYLISVIENDNHHFRVIISSLDLLANMKLPYKEKIEIENLFLSKLKNNNIDSTNSKENDLKIKSSIITCVQKFNFHNTNSSYLAILLEVFKEEDDKNINHSLLQLINSLEREIDIYYEFIFIEFLRIFKIKKRNKEDERYARNTYLIEEIVLKLKSQDNFLNIVGYFFDDYGNHIDFDDDFVSKIFEKCKKIMYLDNTFIIRILEIIKRRKFWHLRENELVDLIVSTNSNDLVIDMFIKNEIPFSESKYLVSRLITDNNLEALVKKFIEENTTSEEVEVFRNILGNTNDRKLALRFEEIMNSNDFIFKERFDTEEDIENFTKERLLRKQHNFDILFDRVNLKNGFKIIYDEIEKESIDWKSICSYQSKWYKKNGHSIQIDAPISFLINLIRDNGSLTYLKVLDLIDDDDILINEIGIRINTELKVSSDQLNIISNWCFKSIDEINYDKIIIVDNEDYTVFFDYNICKNIYKFQKMFSLELPQEFYIKTLKYCDLESYDKDPNEFDYNKIIINSKEVFDNLVIENINTSGLHLNSLRRHISYALENNLSKAFEKIKDNILNKSLYFRNETLEKLYEKTNDLEFMKRCCDDVDSGLCWESIKILIANNLEEQFIIDIANNYLASKFQNYRMQALGVLFKFNQSNSLEVYFNHVKNDLGESIKPEYYSGFDNEKGLEQVKKFYYLLYNRPQDEDIFKYHHAKELYRKYISNISSKDEKSFRKLQKELYKIKRSLKVQKKMNKLRKYLVTKKILKDFKNDEFYINSLIEDSLSSYINFKSKPLKFEEAKLKIEIRNI